MSSYEFGSFTGRDASLIERFDSGLAAERRYSPHDDADDADCAVDADPQAPPEGDHWSSWDGASHGPKPRPDWVITDLGAVEADLGVLKTGKEADVHLVRRWLPGSPDRDVVMAGKRYRASENRMFHRDAGYLEPYPVQLSDDEMLMEFIGDAEGRAAPRLVQTRPDPALLPGLFEQLRTTMMTLAELGWAHGDLSPYNVLLAGEGDNPHLVIIDWPQIVDVIGNPHGPEFLERDARNMGDWFTRRGFEVDHGLLFGDLMAAATARW